MHLMTILLIGKSLSANISSNVDPLPHYVY